MQPNLVSLLILEIESGADYCALNPFLDCSEYPGSGKHGSAGRARDHRGRDMHHGNDLLIAIILSHLRGVLTSGVIDRWADVWPSRSGQPW